MATSTLRENAVKARHYHQRNNSYRHHNRLSGWYCIVFTARNRSLRRLCFYRCLSVHTGGHAQFYSGGVHGFIWGGMCGFIYGWGACVVLFRGRAWFYSGGMHGFIWGACMVLFGGHAWFHSGGHAWFYLGGHVCFFQFFRIQWDTVNEQAVRILLECILVNLVNMLLWWPGCCCQGDIHCYHGDVNCYHKNVYCYHGDVCCYLSVYEEHAILTDPKIVL